ncbi:phage tail terminator protein [Pseudomonas protegens]|uniref:phage tail terminator protein n=1 Tax=Pseudomonas protegens TaxID=380021 RepID=UPI00069E5496
MNVKSLIDQIDEFCLGLKGLVSFAIGLKGVEKSPLGDKPVAYVNLVGDLVRQTTQHPIVREQFEVLVVLDASQEPLVAATTQLYQLRAEVWRALVGFKPGAEYNPIQYDGGELVSLDATRLLYRLRFFAEFQLGRNLPSQPAETWHERELDGLPSLTGVTVRVDAIDPADPNLQHPGPDGRLELTFSGELKQ